MTSQPLQPKVTLITHTHNPLETMWVMWDASKTRNPTRDVQWVKENVPSDEVERLFWAILEQDIPVGRNLTFTFMLENVSVSFREQMVRHLMGTKAGDNYGVDTIPQLEHSSWWSQSMRIESMGDFADRNAFRLPPSVIDAGPAAVEYYMKAMDSIQAHYNAMVDWGVPLEDARELIPLGAHHRISWSLNLQALSHIFKKRGCWILQLGIWGPVIQGVIDELATKVNPIFRKLIQPPCVKNDKFSACIYREENIRRVDGRDPQPVCPLYVCRDQVGMSVVQLPQTRIQDMELGDTYDPVGQNSRDPQVRKQRLIDGDTFKLPNMAWLLTRAKEYEKFWGHDPYVWDVKSAL